MVPYAMSIIANGMRQKLDTVLARCFAAWWRIKIGKSSKFFGLPFLKRHPTGTIAIGHSATFRSSEWSNSIGINRRCYIEAGCDAKITIGNQCGFSGTVISAVNSISIGDRVICGGNCTIVDTDRHPLVRRHMIHEKAKSCPIVIGEDVFLGMNVTVLKGCTIGRGAVVASNSVVTKSLPEMVLAGGVPARIIRRLNNDK